MSRALLSPNFCSCTVNQARGLPEKGKHGGVDPFCTISMGKEKFMTAVREKTSSPDWHEQCDMPIVDDATIKLTVYHHNKNSLSKGDFIGRAYVLLRDLEDYDRVHNNWYKLTNKEGKLDKNRGEIEVSLQFYSKNNTTGSVLDLSTKKKHLSLKDIKHSLGDKLKSASKSRKHEKYGGENQLADQSRRLGGANGSSYNERDFLDDSVSDTTSFTGSHMSLNSMSYNNNAEQQRKKTRAPSIGLGTAAGSGTPYSSRRSVTSDYETSSILDSASMYGGDENSTPSPTDRFQNQHHQQQQRDVNVDNKLVGKPPINPKKTKEAPSITVPTIITTKPSGSIIAPDRSKKSSVSGDDIEAAFDSIHHHRTSSKKSKDNEISNPFFGPSTTGEHFDTDENTFNTDSSKVHTDEEIDFDNYFHKNKRPDEEKKTKKPAPIFQQPKTTIAPVKEQKRSIIAQSDDIHTPATSISVQPDTNSTSSITLPVHSQSDHHQQDSTDEDIDEVLGTLERISSMRSSVRRRIQPKADIMQQSFFEPDNKPSNTYNQTPVNQKKNTALPDIVGEQAVKGSSPHPANKKAVNNVLSVLGYQNVKGTPINPRIRQELDYLDREELLHVIAYQTDLIKKRDTRVKDLEQYTDGLLVKIVEQCPTILQNLNGKLNSK